MHDGTTTSVGLAAAKNEEVAFADLVARDVRGDVTPAEAAYLRQPGTLDAWVGAITALRERVEGHLTAHRARWNTTHAECLEAGNSGRLRWYQEKATLDEQRRKIRRFQESVFVREREARSLVKARNAAAGQAVPRATLLAGLDDLRAQVADLRAHVARLEAQLAVASQAGPA